MLIKSDYIFAEIHRLQNEDPRFKGNKEAIAALEAMKLWTMEECVPDRDANRVTLDFARNMVEWDTKHQQGTEFCPDLAEREEAILAAMGYSKVDLTPTVTAINSYANGEMTEAEFLKRLAELGD